MWAVTGDAVKASDGSPSNQFGKPVVAYEVGRLVRGTLGEIEMLLPLVEYDDDEYSYFQEIEKELNGLARQMKYRRLAAKLAKVEGREPEEAKLYAAKAAEISGGA